MVLFFVVFLEQSSIVVLTLVCYACSHVSLLFGLKSCTNKNKLTKAHLVLLWTMSNRIWIFNMFPVYFFNISFCGIDVLICLFCILCCTLCFSPLSLKALLTLVWMEERNRKKSKNITFSSFSKELTLKTLHNFKQRTWQVWRKTGLVVRGGITKKLYLCNT